MRARNVSFRSSDRSLAVLTGALFGLVSLGCAQDIDRREFGDAYVPPADTLGGVGQAADDGADDDDDDDGDDDGAADGGAGADDAGDAGVDDGPDPDDGAADDSADDGAADDSGLPDDGGGGSDDGSAADDDGGPLESPYVGGWDIGDCADSIVSTGTSVGDVIPDFSLLDQNGDMVRLYDFCHKAVWLIEGAFW